MAPLYAHNVAKYRQMASREVEMLQNATSAQDHGYFENVPKTKE